MSLIDSLIPRLRAGDAEALPELLAALRNRLIAYIDGRIGNQLRAKIEPADIFQEVSVAAWKYASTTDLSTRDPFGWLCDLADQKISDVARRYTTLKRDVGHEHGFSGFGEPSASHTSPSMGAARNEEAEAIQAALAELPPAAQEVIRLRYDEGLETQEIGRRMGKSDGAVRVLLSRTVEALRRALGRELPDPQ